MINDNIAVKHEIAFGKSFIKKNKKERFIELIQSNQRRKLLSDLNTPSKYIDHNYILQEFNKSSDEILEIMQKYGTPSKVYMFADDPKLDSKELDLKFSVDLALNNDFVAVVSCIPGKMALLVSPESNDIWLLKRKAARQIKSSANICTV